MTLFRNSILATIVYYDIFDFPLTMFEVHKYLINPVRLGFSRSDLGTSLSRSRLSGRCFSPPWELCRSDLKELDLGIMGQVQEGLDGLVIVGAIGSKNGFYFLPGRDGLYELRKKREKISAQKWKKFLRIAKWFQAVPYLRAIFASGSLAINNTDKGSDFDVLSVVRSGRLYTCRIFLCLVASVFGARRTRYEKIAPDKFCFNHYITDRDMNIKHESLFNAQTYANLKPVLASEELFNRFYSENIWLNKYLFKVQSQRFPEVEPFNFPRPDLGVGLKVQPQKICEVEPLKFIAKLLEFVLNSRFGDRVENWAKKYQQKRIKENPATYESGGRVVFTDNELEFHPRSFEAFAIDRYNRGLKQLGITPLIEEKDSGLNI